MFNNNRHDSTELDRYLTRSDDRPTAAQEPTIVLYRSTTAWIADFTFANGADEIFELFGTYELPTPFSSTANPVDVALHISNNNPHDRVIVKDATKGNR